MTVWPYKSVQNVTPNYWNMMKWYDVMVSFIEIQTCGEVIYLRTSKGGRFFAANKKKVFVWVMKKVNTDKYLFTNAVFILSIGLLLGEMNN